MATVKSSHLSLTPGELNILAEAQSDDVSILWILEHLGLSKGESVIGDARPELADIDLAFASITRLVDRGLITVGHFETPEGEHPKDAVYIEETPTTAKARVVAALAQPNDDWERECWAVRADGVDLEEVRAQAAFERFAEEVDDFCGIPIRFAACQLDARPNLLLHSLATLVSLASGLPDIESSGHAAGAVVSESERAEVVARLSNGFGGDIEFWNAEKAPAAAQPGTTLIRLAEELADIWSILVKGLRDLDAGRSSNDVYASWRSTYRSDWRFRAIRALSALHELDAVAR